MFRLLCLAYMSEKGYRSYITNAGAKHNTARTAPPLITTTTVLVAMSYLPYCDRSNNS